MATMIMMNRRTFLSGMIAAPVVMKYTSLMPVKLFGLVQTHGDETIWPVVDTRTGLVVRLPAWKIIEGGSRYMPYLESRSGSPERQRAKAILENPYFDYTTLPSGVIVRRPHHAPTSGI